MTGPAAITQRQRSGVLAGKVAGKLLLRAIERIFLVTGVSLLALIGAMYLDSAISSHAELRRFRELKSKGSVQNRANHVVLPSADFTMWSEQRLLAYQATFNEFLAPPLAILRIRKVHLEVPVLEGTSELVLNRGVGHIPGTVQPGKLGNVGIAGHRDGFFRVLKDVVPGDEIQLETADRSQVYRVNQISIVNPNNTSVLRPRPLPSITLVTCYPFYFIGSAPKRYIVEGLLMGDVPEKHGPEARSGPHVHSDR